MLLIDLAFHSWEPINAKTKQILTLEQHSESVGKFCVSSKPLAQNLSFMIFPHLLSFYTDNHLTKIRCCPTSSVNIFCCFQLFSFLFFLQQLIFLVLLSIFLTSKLLPYHHYCILGIVQRKIHLYHNLWIL